MNSRNELFDYSEKCIMGRRNLKIKVKKIANECFHNSCEKYLKKIKKLYFFELNNERSINNAIKLGQNFHFNKNNYNSINRDMKIINNSLIDETIKIDNDYKHFCKTLKNGFSVNELEAIKNDQHYYIPNRIFRYNLKLFNKINLEKSVLDKSNILKLKKSEYNRYCHNNEDTNQKILTNIKKVKNIIKKGIKNSKDEEKKKTMNKEKIKNLLNKIYKESKNEVNSLIRNKGYKKLFNSISEESFLKEYYKKRCNSIYGNNKTNKIKSDRINKTQINLENISSYNKDIKKYPKIFSYSLIKRDDSFDNKLFNQNKRLNSCDTSLKYIKNSFLDKSSYSINNSHENKIKKRFERIAKNMEERKKEEDFTKRVIQKIKENYNKKNFRKLNLKEAILNI